MDKYNQVIDDEFYKSKDIRSAPWAWNENFRLGDGTMGLQVIAGLQITIEQANGCVLSEGVLGLDGIFDKLAEDRATHSMSLKIEGRPCVGNQGAVKS